MHGIFKKKYATDSFACLSVWMSLQLSPLILPHNTAPREVKRRWLQDSLGQLNCLPLAFRKSNQTPKTIADRLQLASSSQTTERKKRRDPHIFSPILTFDSLPDFSFRKIIWNRPQRGQQRDEPQYTHQPSQTTFLV